MRHRKMTRRERIAAEMFSYSLANYADHLEIENERFTRLMPEQVQLLERASKEGWEASKISQQLDVEESDVPQILQRLKDANKIVNAENASESYRESVRQQLEYTLGTKATPDEIETLVIQMCYCAADLGCLLEWEGKRLTDYSEWLRREPDCDYSEIGLPNLPGYQNNEDGEAD